MPHTPIRLDKCSPHLLVELSKVRRRSTRSHLGLMPLKKPERKQQNAFTPIIAPEKNLLRMRRIMPLSLRSHWGVSKYIVWSIGALRLDHPAKERASALASPALPVMNLTLISGRLASCALPASGHPKKRALKLHAVHLSGWNAPRTHSAKDFQSTKSITHSATICACSGRSPTSKHGACVGLLRWNDADKGGEPRRRTNHCARHRALRRGHCRVEGRSP